MFSSYDCGSVKKLLNEGGILIDVRSAVEFSQGALKGALNMPLDAFQHLIKEIDNSKPVLLYCRSGQRSEMAKRYLQQIGYDDVHNIGSYTQLAFCVT